MLFCHIKSLSSGRKRAFDLMRQDPMWGNEKTPGTRRSCDVAQTAKALPGIAGRIVPIDPNISLTYGFAANSGRGRQLRKT
jgi:hypothetical protein